MGELGGFCTVSTPILPLLAVDKLYITIIIYLYGIDTILPVCYNEHSESQQ